MAALNLEKFTLVTDDTIIIIIEEMRNSARKHQNQQKYCHHYG